MQQQKFVSETSIEHTTSLIQLLELPQPQEADTSGSISIIIGSIIGGGGGGALLSIVVVIAIIG